MAHSQEKFNEAITKVSVPILILDNKWHKLFGKMNPTREIKELENELTTLLKKQGKLVNENKDLKKIKANLMNEIVANMDDASGDVKSANNKKLADNKRLINEANEKYDKNEDVLLDLSRDIDVVNKKLMIASMDMCYERLQSNTEEIEEISAWIKEIRIQLKRNIVKKQDMEIYNSELYSYMHDIFGPEVIELFDMKYVPTIHRGNDPVIDNKNTKKDNNE